jgi:hypothetical protein
VTLNITDRDVGTTSPSGLPFGRRFAWWAAAWALALAVTSMLVAGNPLAIPLLPAFPAGLFFTEKIAAPGLLIGWAAYAAWSVWLVSTPDVRWYRRLFVIFVAVLLVNVFGCQHVAKQVHYEGIL